MADIDKIQRDFERKNRERIHDFERRKRYMENERYHNEHLSQLKKYSNQSYHQYDDDDDSDGGWFIFFIICLVASWFFVFKDRPDRVETAKNIIASASKSTIVAAQKGIASARKAARDNSGPEVESEDTTTTYYPRTMTVIAPGELNVRDGPGVKYNVISKVFSGDKVTVNQIFNGWAEIETGWINSDYIQ